MIHRSNDCRAHWQSVYRTRDADAVSWYRPHLEVSLELLAESGMSAASRLIDVGGGASTLVDDLLARGLRDIGVLDIAEDALAVSRRRLGERAQQVAWYVQDVLEVALPAGRFDYWHDRAVLHFLTDPADARRYAETAANAVSAGGYAVIGGFAPDGPQRCSGLAVSRRSAQEIAALLAPAFALVQMRLESHRTPAGDEQRFVYALLRRRRDADDSPPSAPSCNPPGEPS
jgi:SAM-dependent methyltransferase